MKNTIENYENKEALILDDRMNIFRIGLSKEEIIYWVSEYALYVYEDVFKGLQERNIRFFDSKFHFHE